MDLNTKNIAVTYNTWPGTNHSGKPQAITIDVEASGFGVGSYPIEVGVAFPDGGTQCYLIKPEHDWIHWK